MSFFALLILLSLIVIVPVFFVMKEKSKQTQAEQIQRHQQYLANADKTILSSKTEALLDHQAHQLAVIEFSAQHPFVALLNDERMPQVFCLVMDAIGQQYEGTHHDQITQSQLFTLNKMIETRIPELLNDYLSLDPHYANTVIIDSDHATSHAVVLGQLQSILNFAQKLNTQSQSGVVDKLLASQRYLDTVAKDSGMSDDMNTDILNLK